MVKEKSMLYQNRLVRSPEDIQVTRRLVEANDIASEAVELGVNEIDSRFLPKDVNPALNEVFLYEIMVYDDTNGSEFVGGIAKHPITQKWLLQVITKNGDVHYKRDFISKHEIKDA